MDKLGQYYHSENYISHSNSNKGLMNKAYKIVRSYTLAQKTKLLGKAEGKLLEIGSGTGELLANCEKKGWECQGVEPEEVARKAAFQNHSLKLLASIDELSIQENSLDRIMLWHVLEHVPNLHQTIEKFKGWLKKDGLLFVAVPNHKSWDAKHYKENWAAYDVPRHLYHFDKESMNKLLGQHTLEIKQTRAMLFDSFYISMLSEEIKKRSEKNDKRSNCWPYLKSICYIKKRRVLKPSVPYWAQNSRLIPFKAKQASCRTRAQKMKKRP
jgi:2-polyprenyl-3-methyl-5-hydroxy-6-metoxy-1,4-benzoquinol methylase